MPTREELSKIAKDAQWEYYITNMWGYSTYVSFVEERKFRLIEIGNGKIKLYKCYDGFRPNTLDTELYEHNANEFNLPTEKIEFCELCKNRTTKLFCTENKDQVLPRYQSVIMYFTCERCHYNFDRYYNPSCPLFVGDYSYLEQPCQEEFAPYQVESGDHDDPSFRFVHRFCKQWQLDNHKEYFCGENRNVSVKSLDHKYISQLIKFIRTIGTTRELVQKAGILELLFIYAEHRLDLFPPTFKP